MDAQAPAQKAARRDPRIFLWKAGGLVAVFLLTFIVGNFCISKDRAVTRRMLGHDFLVFYFGGTCARTGQYQKLYDLDAARDFERATGRAADLELGESFGPWWNPPFAAWMFAPLSAFSYRRALALWWMIELCCLIASLFLLCRMLRGDWKTKLLVPLFLLTAMPFIQAASHAQNTFVSLLLLTITVGLWRSGRGFAAGLVCGLLLYKPQLAAVVAIVLCLSQGWAALAGVGAMGLALLAINLLSMPGSLHDFLVRMPANLHWMQVEHRYLWQRHVTFKGFWRLLIQGWAVGPASPLVVALWGACAAALAVGLLAVIWHTLRGKPSPSQTDRLIAATIAAMPLLMPFYFDYDLLLLVVAAVVYAADRQRGPAADNGWEDRWLPWVWLVLYLVMEVATPIADHTRLHLTVPLLALTAVLLIRRALRRQSGAATASQPTAPIALPT